MTLPKKEGCICRYSEMRMSDRIGNEIIVVLEFELLNQVYQKH